MAYDVGELLARVEVDLSGLKEGLNKATSQFSLFEGKVDDVNSEIKRATSSMGNSMDTMSSKISKVAQNMGGLNSAIRQTSSNSLQAIQQLASNGESQLRGLDIGFRTMREGIDHCVTELRALNNGLSSLKNPNVNFSSVTSGIKESNAGLSSMFGKSNSLFMSFSRLSLLFYIIKEDIQAVYHAMDAIAGQGISFYKDIETSQIGMAGIIASMTKVNGVQTTWNQALQESKAITKDIADNALLTTVTTKELQMTFQALLAPGLRAGMTIKEITDLSTVGANAVKSMGLKSDQLVQELRDLVQGGITARSSTLATSLGLTDSDIAKAKASSEGLYKFLIRQMQGFAMATNAMGQTLDGYASNIVDAFQRIGAEGLGGFIDYLKTGVLKPLQESLITIESHVNEAGRKVIDSVKPNPALLRFYSLLGDSFEKLIDGGKALGTALLPFFAVLGGTLKIVVDVFALLMEVIGNVILSFADLTGEATTFSDIFILVERVIQTVRDNMALIVEVIDALIIVFAVLNADVLIPVAVTFGVLKLIMSQNSYIGAILAGTMVSLAIAFGLITPHVLAVIACVGALVFAGILLSENWARVKNAFTGYLSGMENKAIAVANNIKSAFYELALKVAGFFNGMIDKINSSPLGKTLGLLGMNLSHIDTSGLENGAINAKQTAVEADNQAGSDFSYGNHNMGIALENTYNTLKGQLMSLTSLSAYSPKTKSLFDNVNHVEGLSVNPKDDDDGSGKGGRGGADKALKDALNADKAQIEGIIALTKEWAKIEEDFINDKFTKGLISIQEHLVGVKTVEYQKHQQVMLSLQQEMDEASEKENSQAEQQKIKNKMDMEELKFFETSIKYVKDSIKEYEDLSKTIVGISESFDKMTGNVVSSNISTFFEKNKLTIMKINSEIENANKILATSEKNLNKEQLATLQTRKKSAEEYLNVLTKTTIQQRELYNISYYTSKITELQNGTINNGVIDAGLKGTLAKIALQKQLSSEHLTDLQINQQAYDLGKKDREEVLNYYVKLIANNQLAYDTSGQAQYLENVVKLRAEYQKFADELPPVQQKLKETLTSGFEGAFKALLGNTKSVKNAMNDMLKGLSNDFYEEESKKMTKNLKEYLKISKSKDETEENSNKFESEIAKQVANFKKGADTSFDIIKTEVVKYTNGLNEQYSLLESAIKNNTIPSMMDLADTIAKYVIPTIIGQQPAENFNPHKNSDDAKAIQAKIDADAKNANIKDNTKAIAQDKVNKNLATSADDAKKGLKDTANKTKDTTQQLLLFGQSLALATGNEGLMKFVNGIMMIMDLIKKIQALSGVASIGKASGGYISGSGTTTSDSIPARLSNGEFVVRASSVNRYGKDFFELLNRGQLPKARFSEGGSVSTSSQSIGSASTISTATQSPVINFTLQPSFHSLDPAQNQKMFESQLPMMKAKMIEYMQRDPAFRNAMKGAVK